MYITVEGNRAEIQNGGSAAHNIEGDPGIAELRTEDPVAEEVVHPGKCHHQATDEEVGDREGG